MLYSSRSRQQARHRRSVLSRLSFALSLLFTTFVTAPSVGAVVISPPLPAGHTRALSLIEMQRIVGADGIRPEADTSQTLAADGASGSTYAWEASTASGLNTGNGNKLTDVSLVGWRAKGGRLSVGLTLFHNSQGSYNRQLGPKWSHSYDIYLVVDAATGNATVRWGDGLAYRFIKNLDNSFSAPSGIFDTLSFEDTSYTLVKKDQTRCQFTQTAGQWYASSLQDRNNNTVTINRDATSGHVTSVVDPSGRTLSLSYNAQGDRITSVSDPLGRVWTISYDANGALSQIEFPAVGGTAATMSLGYDGDHRITQMTDVRGQSWTLGYNGGDGSLAWEQNPLGQQSSYSYTAGQTTITDARGFQSQHHYASGRLVSTLDQTQEAGESFSYDGQNNKTQVIDKRGHAWTYTYDDRGNVLTATNPLNHTTTYTYTASNDVASVQTPLGHVTMNGYDGAGNLVSTSDALGHATTLIRDGWGQVTQVTDALSHSTTMAYDADGNPISTSNALGQTTSVGYDGLGRPTSTTDALGRVTTTAYDERGRVTSVTLPGGRTTTFAYDNAGNKTGQTNANGETQAWVYDGAGRLASHTDALNRSVSFGYDATGNKTQFTDGNGNTTSYGYTARGQLASISYPDGTSESYGYLPTGELSHKTDGRGVSVARGYDNAGRLTLIDYPDQADTSFSYDADSRRTGMADGTGTTSYAFDAASRLTQRATPQGSVGFSYDEANRLSVRTLAGVGMSTFGYDEANRLTSASAPSAGGTTSYVYDGASRLVQSTSGNNSVESRSYTAAGDVSQVWHKTDGAATISQHSYGYDGVGRRTSETLADGTVLSFGYDAAGQLTQESRSNAYAIGYSYDTAGNRLSKSVDGVTEAYSYDAANKLLSAGEKSYSYDGAGNVTSVNTAAGTTSLSWDSKSRLVGITYPSGGSNSFVYNGLDQRVGKADSSGAFSYTLADDRIDSAVLSDGAASYHHGRGLVSESRGGTSTFYHADALGTTRALSDGSQGVTDTKETDAFGNTWTPGTTGTNPTPFGFAAQHGYQSDADSGLMRLGYRYYDASVGRFLSRDPIQAGYNWYTYCDNDPVNAVDPEGLQAPSPATPSPATTFFEAVGRGFGRVFGVVGLLLLENTPAGDPRYDTLPLPENAKKSKRSDKERATDVPSWSRHYPKLEDESCREFAERILIEQYGPDDPRAKRRGAGSEFNKIVKECERGD